VARAVLLGWVKEDPAAALSRLGEVAPGGRQGYFATTTEGQVLKIAGEHSFDATVAWMRDNPGKISDSLPQLARIARGNKVFLQLLAERWFQVDP